MTDFARGLRGATARKVADETGRCPECGAQAEASVAGDVLLLSFTHEAGCCAVEGIAANELAITENRNSDLSDLAGWERDALEDIL